MKTMTIQFTLEKWLADPVCSILIDHCRYGFVFNNLEYRIEVKETFSHRTYLRGKSRFTQATLLHSYRRSRYVWQWKVLERQDLDAFTQAGLSINQSSYYIRRTGSIHHSDTILRRLALTLHVPESVVEPFVKHWFSRQTMRALRSH